DPLASDPILLRPGDHVRFRRIDRAEYNEIGGRDSDRAIDQSSTVIASGHGRGDSPGARALIKILEPGPQTTVQDLGRPGQLRYGIPQSGPMGRAAFVLANRLVADGDTGAGLEGTVVGPRFAAAAPCCVAAAAAAQR